MESNALEPVNVEIVSVEDLSGMPVLGKVEQQSDGIGFIQRAGTVLGMVPDVIETAGSKNLYKVTVPDGCSLSDLISSAKGDGSLRALVKDSKGRLNGDVSLKLNGINAAQIASFGIGAMAMVVG